MYINYVGCNCYPLLRGFIAEEETRMYYPVECVVVVGLCVQFHCFEIDFFSLFVSE